MARSPRRRRQGGPRSKSRPGSVRPGKVVDGLAVAAVGLTLGYAWSEIERGGTKKRLPKLPRAGQLSRDEQDRQNFTWQARPNNVVFTHDRLEALRYAQEAYATGETLDEANSEVLVPVELG